MTKVLPFQDNPTNMEQIGKFKIYSSEEVLDKHFGKVGTPRREKFEKKVTKVIQTHQK